MNDSSFLSDGGKWIKRAKTYLEKESSEISVPPYIKMYLKANYIYSSS